jgi:hypothetical protein
MNRFMQQTLPLVNRKHLFINILRTESLPTKKHNRTLLFGNTLRKNGRHFDYWNQPLNMCICYLKCHKAGLCCHLVIHIENLLHITAVLLTSVPSLVTLLVTNLLFVGEKEKKRENKNQNKRNFIELLSQVCKQHIHSQGSFTHTQINILKYYSWYKNRKYQWNPQLSFSLGSSGFEH